MTRKQRVKHKNPKVKKPRCEKKNRYYSSDRAWFAAGIMTQAHGTKFDAYWCSIHKCWHVGHAPGKTIKGFPRQYGETQRHEGARY